MTKTNETVAVALPFNPKSAVRRGSLKSFPIPKLLCLAFMGILSSCVSAQTSEPASMPTSAPAVVATAPATTPASMPTSTSSPAISEDILKILKDWQATGDENKTLTADIEYKVENSTTGDVEVRTGTTAYQKETDKTPACFRVQFDTLKTDNGAPRKEDVIYAFDGMWLRVLKAKLKQLARYQVALAGEKIEPLRLGKNMVFPLPFGQRMDDVLENFNVSTRKATKSDPADTDYLQLVPKADKARDQSYTRLNIWLDKKTHLPVKIVTFERNKNISTVLFKNIKAGQPLKDIVFSPAKPDGWEEIVEPLKK